VRTAASVLSVAVLLDVPALALAHLGADTFSFWTGEASRTGLPDGLLPVDAPAATVSVHQACAEDARRTLAAALPGDEVTVVRNWQYLAISLPLIGTPPQTSDTGGATPTTPFSKRLLFGQPPFPASPSS
jgi:hypothetical protein